MQKKELWEYLKNISKEFKRETIKISSNDDKNAIKRAFLGL